MNKTHNNHFEFQKMISLLNVTNIIFNLSSDLYDVLREQMDKYPNAGYWLGKDPWLITGDIKIFNVSCIDAVAFYLWFPTM